MRMLALALPRLLRGRRSAAARRRALSGLRFSDGKERSFADFPEQGVMVVYFCGHCPVAAAYLGKQVKALHDYIEEHKVPVTLVLTTPDFGPADTVALNRDRSYHMDHALWASDPANARNISLQNVYQVSVFGGDHRERDTLQNTAAVPAFEAFFRAAMPAPSVTRAMGSPTRA